MAPPRKAPMDVRLARARELAAQQGLELAEAGQQGRWYLRDSDGRLLTGTEQAGATFPQAEHYLLSGEAKDSPPRMAAPEGTFDRVRENTARRAAQRQGLRLAKIQRRDPAALGWNRWLLRGEHGRLLISNRVRGTETGASLDEVEKYLRNAAAGLGAATDADAVLELATDAPAQGNGAGPETTLTGAMTRGKRRHATRPRAGKGGDG